MQRKINEFMLAQKGGVRKPIKLQSTSKWVYIRIENDDGHMKKTHTVFVLKLKDVSVLWGERNMMIC